VVGHGGLEPHSCALPCISLRCTNWVAAHRAGHNVYANHPTAVIRSPVVATAIPSDSFTGSSRIPPLRWLGRLKLTNAFTPRPRDGRNACSCRGE